MDKPRICIIGNSHAAAIQAGLELMPELREQCSIDFFAAHSNFMKDMEVRGTLIVPRSDNAKQKWKMSSGGMMEIDTSRYTHYVIVGLGFNSLTAIYALRKYQLYEFAGNSNRSAPYISRACFRQLMISTLNNSPAMYFARLLSNLGKRQIVLIPQPYPGEEILNGKYEFSELWVRGVEIGSISYATRLYRDAAERVTKEVGCALMFQPPATVGQELFTQARFSLNSSLGDEQSRDPYHMNKWFGVEILKKISAEMNWNIK